MEHISNFKTTDFLYSMIKCFKYLSIEIQCAEENDFYLVFIQLSISSISAQRERSLKFPITTFIIFLNCMLL